VDTREPRDVVAILKELGLPFIRRKLDIGDFKSPSCLFERKTFQDLSQSIMTGHMTDQLERMYYYCADHHLIGFLCVSGTFEEAQQEAWRQGRQLNPNVFYGLFSSALVRYGVNVIWNLRDTYELLEVIWRVAEKVEEGKLDTPRLQPLRAIHPDKRIALVSSVLRVSPRIARNLLRKFRSMRGILMARDDELLLVDGIGKTTLERIKSLVW